MSSGYQWWAFLFLAAGVYFGSAAVVSPEADTRTVVYAIVSGLGLKFAIRVISAGVRADRLHRTITAQEPPR